MKNHTVSVLKSIADETRFTIVKELSKVKELTCQELMKRFPLSQPTLSHHFNRLVDTHVLLSRKDGQYWIYRLNTSYLTSLGIDIKKLTQSKHH